MSEFKSLLGLVILGSLVTAPGFAAPAGPIAEWTFDVGRSDVVRDRSGNGPATLKLFVGTRYHDRREGIFTNGGVNPAVEDYGDPYQVTVDGKTTKLEERDGLLTVPLQLDGQVTVEIKPD